MNYLQSLEQIENSNESFIVKNYAKYLKNQLYLAQHLGKINENVLENVSDFLETKKIQTQQKEEEKTESFSWGDEDEEEN